MLAIDLSAAFLADLGQVGPDLAPLPPKRVALRAPGLIAGKERLAAPRVAAGEVRQDQGRRRRCRGRQAVPRATMIWSRASGVSVSSPADAVEALSSNGRRSRPVLNAERQEQAARPSTSTRPQARLGEAPSAPFRSRRLTLALTQGGFLDRAGRFQANRHRSLGQTQECREHQPGRVVRGAPGSLRAVVSLSSAAWSFRGRAKATSPSTAARRPGPLPRGSIPIRLQKGHKPPPNRRSCRRVGICRERIQRQDVTRHSRMRVCRDRQRSPCIGDLNADDAQRAQLADLGCPGPSRLRRGQSTGCSARPGVCAIRLDRLFQTRRRPRAAPPPRLAAGRLGATTCDWPSCERHALPTIGGTRLSPAAPPIGRARYPRPKRRSPSRASAQGEQQPGCFIRGMRRHNSSE